MEQLLGLRAAAQAGHRCVLLGLLFAALVGPGGIRAAPIEINMTVEFVGLNYRDILGFQSNILSMLPTPGLTLPRLLSLPASKLRMTPAVKGLAEADHFNSVDDFLPGIAKFKADLLNALSNTVRFGGPYGPGLAGPTSGKHLLSSLNITDIWQGDETVIYHEASGSKGRSGRKLLTATASSSKPGNGDNKGASTSAASIKAGNSNVNKAGGGDKASTPAVKTSGNNKQAASQQQPAKQQAQQQAKQQPQPATKPDFPKKWVLHEGANYLPTVAVSLRVVYDGHHNALAAWGLLGRCWGDFVPIPGAGKALQEEWGIIGCEFTENNVSVYAH